MDYLRNLDRSVLILKRKGYSDEAQLMSSTPEMLAVIRKLIGLDPFDASAAEIIRLQDIAADVIAKANQ